MMGVAGFCEAGQDTNDAPDVQARRSRFKEVFDRLQPIVVHGKVIDQDANAVAGAQVKIGWESARFLAGNPDPGQVSWVTSDASGSWEFRIEKPHRAFVGDACKPGYEYVYTKDSDKNLVESKTTKKEPAIVRLRRKGETTFLIIIPSGNRIGNQLARVLSPHSQTSRVDLLAEQGAKPAAASYTDLQTAVNFDGTSGKWTVTYSATNGTDGIVISSDLLYEAPQQGYREAVVVNGPPWPRYLYLRSRTPAIYARLDLEHSTWKESETNQGIRIGYKAWINPYGSRNLEYESDLAGQWQLRKQLEREAKADLLQNKRPAKPDLPTLVKEAKEKAEKDKGKQ